MQMINYKRFVEESWHIEGLEPSEETIEVLAGIHEYFVVKAEKVDAFRIAELADAFTGGRGAIRDRIGMNVRVGEHVPIPGGVTVKTKLLEICDRANNDEDPHVIHRDFESLHPFMDGNGRTGRLLWLWMMHRQNKDCSLGFLHEWYYQSLNAGRTR